MTQYNLTLTAKKKLDIKKCLYSAEFKLNQFQYVTQVSECVKVYVEHSYRILDGYEPTDAEAICLSANKDYYFTFERNSEGIFWASCEVAPFGRARGTCG